MEIIVAWLFWMLSVFEFLLTIRFGQLLFFLSIWRKRDKKYNELKRSENRDSPENYWLAAKVDWGVSPSFIVFPKHVLTCTTPNPQNAMGEQRQYLWGSETGTQRQAQLTYSCLSLSFIFKKKSNRDLWIWIWIKTSSKIPWHWFALIFCLYEFGSPDLVRCPYHWFGPTFDRHRNQSGVAGTA